MGVYRLTRYARDNHLYEEVDLQEIANSFRSRNIGNPVIAVDGSECAWYLYGDTDSICGGQYKEFREKCKCFVERFRDMGYELYFFFFGLPVEEKTSFCLEDRAVKAQTISEFFARLRVAQSEKACHIEQPRRLLPSAVVPCATVTFKQLGCKVRQSVTDRDVEVAQFAASNKCCVGVLSNDSDFLIYDSIPCFFTFSDLTVSERVTTLCFRSADIASHLGIGLCDLPTFASFVGNAVVRRETLVEVHKNLRRKYRHKETAELVAELLNDCQGDMEKMCKVSFGDNWRECLELVYNSVCSYSCEVGVPVPPRNSSRWDAVLRGVEARHVSGEIPRYLFTVMKCRVLQFNSGLQDLSVRCPNSPPTGLVLRHVLRRMCVVLLWDSGPGPFLVMEDIQTGIRETHRETVKVQKTLPDGIDHPGLLELWSGAEDDRWHIFTWVISPAEDLPALRALFPQHLVVPTAALLYLYQEAEILTENELRTFVTVAVSVKNFSGRQLSELRFGIPTERGIYLATLFVQTALSVLDVAGTCGLSFPQPSECHLDAYFDGKLFQYVYNESKRTPDLRTLTEWDESCEETFGHIMKIIVMQSGTAS